MKILSGTSNLKLSKDISKNLKLKLINTNIKRFADGEIYIEVNENIRGNSVFVIQSTSNPANDNIMELLLVIDALRRSSAKTITAVIPYFGYARQDRKVAPRTSISAKVVANLISNAGASRVVTVDLHAGQIQGFFDMPVDNLYTAPLFAKYIKKKLNNKKLICVSPDVGGVQRTRGLATRIKADLAIIDKRRPAPGKSQVMNIIGDVKNKTCILLDDIADSAGTLCNAAEALKKNGAKEIYSYIVHGVLSGSAHEKIADSVIKELVLTDTIEPTNEVKNTKNIRHISIAPLMGEAIKRINSDASVSALFD